MRTGKIARLPQKIRDQLNCRLQDGEPGTHLVAWLNPLPEVQAVLAAQFGGRAINEPNLTDWKQGGYRDWLRHQESRDVARRLAERTDELNDDLDDDSGCQSVSNQLSVVLGVELAQLAETLLAETTDPKERWKYLKELLQQLGELRREDQRIARIEIERERWDHEFGCQIEKQHQADLAMEKQITRGAVLERVYRSTRADAYGGGEAGGKIADLIYAINYDLPLPDFNGSEKSDQTEAPIIKPN